MRYTKVIRSEDDGTRFVDVEAEQSETPFAANVPPVMVSQPLPATGLVFVTTPEDLLDTEPHPSPHRQIVIVLDGEFEIQTTDGQRRVLPPRGVALLEDTSGRGHVTRVSKGRASFVAVPLAD